MKVMQFRTGHKIILGVLLAVLAGLLSIANVQGSSNSFTLTEIDPTGNNYAGKWQYKAQTNSPQDTITSRHDSPWHWRHYDPTESDREHIKCDDIQHLYPANPNSPDTVISADGQTVTVNIYQAKDSVYVCFALECDDGSYSFVLMRNLQTEKTIRSGPCGGVAGTSSIPTTNNDPPVTTNNDPPVVEEEEEEEEETTTTTTTTTNPLVPSADPITTDPLPDDDDDDDDDNDDDNNDPPKTDNPTTTKTDPPPEIIPKTEAPDSQNTPKTDNDDNSDDNSGQTEQTAQEPVVTTNPPVVRTEQYQGSWK